MEVILLQDVQGLGYENDIVTVKNGYGRNFLIPQKLAIIANQANRNISAQKSKLIQARLDELKAQYDKVAEKLTDQTVKVGAKVGQEGKIFGSVTTMQVSEAIKSQLGVEVDRRIITLSTEVKELGTYPVRVQLQEDIAFDMNIEVISE